MACLCPGARRNRHRKGDIGCGNETAGRDRVSASFSHHSGGDGGNCDASRPDRTACGAGFCASITQAIDRCSSSPRRCARRRLRFTRASECRHDLADRRRRPLHSCTRGVDATNSCGARHVSTSRHQAKHGLPGTRGSSMLSTRDTVRAPISAGFSSCREDDRSDRYFRRDVGGVHRCDPAPISSSNTRERLVERP